MKIKGTGDHEYATSKMPLSGISSALYCMKVAGYDIDIISLPINGIISVV